MRLFQPVRSVFMVRTVNMNVHARTVLYAMQPMVHVNVPMDIMERHAPNVRLIIFSNINYLMLQLVPLVVTVATV